LSSVRGIFAKINLEKFSRCGWTFLFSLCSAELYYNLLCLDLWLCKFFRELTITPGKYRVLQTGNELESTITRSVPVHRLIEVAKLPTGKSRRRVLPQVSLAVILVCQFACTDAHFAAFADEPPAVIALNNEAVKALNSNNFPLAIQKFEAALKIDPRYELARKNLAIAHNNYGLQNRNNPKVALSEFHKALFLDPSNATTLQNVNGIIVMMGKDPKSFADRKALGKEAQLSSDFIGAIIEYGEACKIKDDPKLHVEMGNIFRVRDDNDSAIIQYQQAARLQDSAEIEVKMGQAYMAKKDVPNAIACFGKALALKPDDPDVLDALFVGWDTALKENPMAPENHIGLGQALQFRGDFSQAEKEYKLAIQLSPGRQNAVALKLLNGLGQAQKDATLKKYIDGGVDNQTRKNYPAAEDSYKRALQIDPQNDAVWVDLGTLYQAMKQWKNALMCYNQALKFNPGNKDAVQGVQTATNGAQDEAIDANYQAGGNLFKQGKYDEAIAKYKLVLQMSPKDPATHFDLGATYQAKGDFDNAIAEYKIAAGLDPKNAEYSKAIANAIDAKAKPIVAAAVKMHAAKDYNGAIAGYLQALQLQPGNAAVWYNVASAYYSIQNYQAAQQAYQKAYDTDSKGQVDCLYLIGTIEENNNRGQNAVTDYLKYLNQAPNGTYAKTAKERLTALNKNIADVLKIKSEAELNAIKQADDAYTQAVAAQSATKYPDAIAAYQKAIQLQPKNADYVYSLGTCFQAAGQMADAVSQYQKAIAMEPTNKDFKKALEMASGLQADPIIDEGVKKQTAGDLKGAITLYRQALQISPNSPRAHTDLGTALQQSDDFQNAGLEYDAGYKLDPKNEVGDLYLGAVIDENFNRAAQAVDKYKRYLKEAPSGQYAQAAKERVAVLLKNPSATAKLATQAEQQRQRTSAEAFENAVKLQQASKYDEALAQYDIALGADPNNDGYWYSKGTAFQAKGDIANAIKCYDKAISIAPNNKQYKDTRGQAIGAQSAPIMDQAVAKHQAGDLPAAIALYKQALGLDPNNAHGWTNLGGAQQASEDFNAAKASYAQALKLDPKGEVDNWYFIGLLDENANQGARAVDDYTKYLQQAPKGSYAIQAQQRYSTLKVDPSKVQKIVTAAESKKNADAQNAYDEAVKLQQANKYDDAIASYKKAIAAAPNEASYYYSMGTAYQAKSDFDGALENYKKAAALNPKEPAYKQVIKQVLQAKAQPLVDSAIAKQTAATPDLAGSIADYEAALKINEDPLTLAYLGTAYQAQNNLAKAQQDYLRAIQMDPKAPDPHYYLGTVYEAQKKKLDAIREYETYLKLAPTGSNAQAVKDALKGLRGK
jgi:superkiller protein 3